MAVLGTVSFTATSRVCLEFSAPPVVSAAKPTLAMKGAIAPLGVKETFSEAGADEVMRKTSDQLVVRAHQGVTEVAGEVALLVERGDGDLLGGAAGRVVGGLRGAGAEGEVERHGFCASTLTVRGIVWLSVPPTTATVRVPL